MFSQYLDADELQRTTQQVENDIYSLFNFTERSQLEEKVLHSKYIRHLASKTDSAVPMKLPKPDNNQFTSCASPKYSIVKSSYPKPVDALHTKAREIEDNHHQFPSGELSSEDIQWLGKKNVKTLKEMIKLSKTVDCNLMPVGYTNDYNEDYKKNSCSSYQNILAKTNQREKLRHKAECLINKIESQEEVLENQLADLSFTSTSSISSVAGLPFRCFTMPQTEKATNSEENEKDSCSITTGSSKNEAAKSTSSRHISNSSMLDVDWLDRLIKNELELQESFLIPRNRFPRNRIPRNDK